MAREIADDGGRAIALAADVSDRGRVEDAVDQMRAALGPITILASDEAGYVTGQVIGVNGGRYI